MHTTHSNTQYKNESNAKNPNCSSLIFDNYGRPGRSRCEHYIFVLWLSSPYGIGQTIIFLPCRLFFLLFLSSPNLSRRRLDVCHTSTHDVANLQCRSEMCCTRLAGNAGPKKSPKIRHLGTIAQLCQAISSQLRHVSTIWKNLLSSNTSSTCPHNMANFGLLTAEIGLPVWGTPSNFNGFRILVALVHGTPVVGVSQFSLRRWTEGATYIRQGDHHVGPFSHILVSSIYGRPM